MIARSRSGKSQPGKRWVREAFVPETNSVQSCALSSSQRPFAFFRTISPVFGGRLVPNAGFNGGSKVAPEFGGGFWPPYGPFVRLIGLSINNRFLNRGPMIVVAFPDSKMAAYTLLPSALT